MKKILYLSYDGMTDPLGQSQVINYLIGLTKYGYSFDILSFEKPKKFAAQKKYIEDLLAANGIKWYPQIFHSTPPILSKLYDKNKFYQTAKKLHQKNKYNLIHCRSYLSAEIGLKLKQKTGVKFLFDMRGFWPDEKLDGGNWNQKKWFWRAVYKNYKKKEKQFIENANYIISLTLTAKNEIEKWPFYNMQTPIEVIPCCADSDHFAITNDNKKIAAKKKLQIPNNTFVVSYLGSTGTWYMLNEMLLFFKTLSKIKNDAIFLIITNSKIDEVKLKIKEQNLPLENFRIINVPFRDVPFYMYASDISISFIKPVYSKMSSSPVKIGETLSMGIPIIVNDIGDLKKLIEKYNVGIFVDGFEEKNWNKILNEIDSIKTISPIQIRNAALENFSLKIGITKYAKVYQQLF